MNPLYPQLEKKTPIQLHCESLTDRIHTQLVSSCSVLSQIWRDVWEHPLFIPQEIFDELGTDGAKMLQDGYDQVQYVTGVISSRGLTESDYIEERFKTTKYPVTVNPDGTVIVQMPE